MKPALEHRHSRRGWPASPAQAVLHQPVEEPLQGNEEWLDYFMDWVKWWYWPRFPYWVDHHIGHC